MIPRNITNRLLESLSDTPVVFLNGARQTGKSTLVKMLAEKAHPARYLTLDDATVLAAATADPAGFVGGLEGPVIIDEVQREPRLFLAIKAEVDRSRKPGRFLLTGSANVLLLPRLAETLVGRMEILTLWPFSQGEIDGVREEFIDALFAGQAAGSLGAPGTKEDLVGRVRRGGFPEAVARESDARRKAWFESYVIAILQRDVRDLANVERLSEMPRLMSLLAARAGKLLNTAELARSLGFPLSTLRRYLTLLETTFLLRYLPPWTANLGKRVVKSPKVFLCDTGLLSHLLGIDAGRDTAPDLVGALLESFVVMEIQKQVTWSDLRPKLFHFRAQTGQEVDFVLEDAGGGVVAIEVKAASTVGEKDFRGLRFLKEKLGPRFRGGTVLYTGRETVPFAPDLHALPVWRLWQA